MNDTAATIAESETLQVVGDRVQRVGEHRPIAFRQR